MKITKIINKLKQLKYRWYSRNIIRPYFLDQTITNSFSYSSQSGQDRWVAEILFPGKVDGTFIDVGAHDGITFSNSLYFEKLGWTGIAIEPNPEVYQKLKNNRLCMLVNACISDISGMRKFRQIEGYSEMLSGLVDDYDPQHKDRISSELIEKGGTCKEISVNCYTLNKILDMYQITSVDYLSIDVEGAELSILQAIDYYRFQIKVIGVENNYGDYRIPQLLSKKGYYFHSRVGSDEFYLLR